MYPIIPAVGKAAFSFAKKGAIGFAKSYAVIFWAAIGSVIGGYTTDFLNKNIFRKQEKTKVCGISLDVIFSIGGMVGGALLGGYAAFLWISR